MKVWGVIDKDFPKPSIKAFLQSKETMVAVKLRIAVIEKSLKDSDDSEEKQMKPKNAR